MEFTPPLTERKTKELLKIISNDKKWSKEIQTLAEEELFRRNFSKQNIEEEKQKRKNIFSKYSQRKTSNLEKSRSESYTLIEMISTIIFFPFSFVFLQNPLTEFWKLDEGNFKKKIRQRIILIILSIFLWFQLLKLIF